MHTLSALLAQLEHEPVVKRVGVVGVAQAVVTLAFGMGWINADQLAALTGFLAVFATPAAIVSSRAKVTPTSKGD